MGINNPRVGQYGVVTPTKTLCGNEAVQPFGCTIGLGGDFYVVKDIFACPDWQERLAELKAEVNAPKQRKVYRIDES